MHHFDETSYDGKNVIYVDCSAPPPDNGLKDILDAVQNAIASRQTDSLNAIVNFRHTYFDSKTMNHVRTFLQRAMPCLTKCVFIGVDGVKKMILESITKANGLKAPFFAFGKKKALELILETEQETQPSPDDV